MSDSSQTTLVTLYVFDSLKSWTSLVVLSHSVDSIALLQGLIAGNSVRVGYLIGIGSVHLGRRMHVRHAQIAC